MFTERLFNSMKKVAEDLISTQVFLFFRDNDKIVSKESIDSIRVSLNLVDNDFIVLQVNAGYPGLFVFTGREAGGDFPTPARIRQWLRIRGLDTDDRTIYLVSRSIAVYGFPGLEDVFIQDLEQRINRVIRPLLLTTQVKGFIIAQMNQGIANQVKNIKLK